MGVIRPFITGVFVCAVTGPVAADTIKYTDKTSFLTAAPGELSTIQFENAPNGSQTYIGNSYTVGGVTFKSNHMYLADGNVYSGWFSLGTGDTLLAGYEYASGPTTLLAELSEGTRVVALDIGLEKGGSYIVNFDTGEQISGILGAQTFDGVRFIRDGDFVGIISDKDIASILFESNGGGWKVVDNFITGNGVPVAAIAADPAAVAPLPGAAWGGMALIGGLGVARRLRRRNDSAMGAD